MSKTVIIMSGGFDPVHIGHVRMFNWAKTKYNEHGEHLSVVGVNSDEWLKRKKGFVFMPERERIEIISAFRDVDNVMRFDDDDDTAIDLIKKCIKYYGLQYTYIFANGGDRTENNIPECEVDYEVPVLFQFGVGGDTKAQSSSTLVQRIIKNAKNDINFIGGNGTSFKL